MKHCMYRVICQIKNQINIQNTKLYCRKKRRKKKKKAFDSYCTFVKQIST